MMMTMIILTMTIKKFYFFGLKNDAIVGFSDFAFFLDVSGADWMRFILSFNCFVVFELDFDFCLEKNEAKVADF